MVADKAIGPGRRRVSRRMLALIGTGTEYWKIIELKARSLDRRNDRYQNFGQIWIISKARNSYLQYRILYLEERL